MLARAGACWCMPLTVLSVAYPFAAVGPDAVGGSEQVLAELDRELVSSGNTSLVVACFGSQTAGRLFPVSLPDNDFLDEVDRRAINTQFKNTIERVLATYPVDLIHMHGLNFYEYIPATSVPILVTLHLPISWYPQEVLHRCHRTLQLQCVSETQRLSCPPQLRDVPVVTNGVAIPHTLKSSKSDFAIALGRVCPEKNQHAALEAGSLAHTRVLLGGQVFPYKDHQRYFEEKLAPLLKSNGSGVSHEFLGPLAPAQKQDLLASAKCLLHPTVAPETSSLVAMEAMAAGTPVIAYRSGALPEIVEHGETGFLVDGVKEMADAIGKVDTIHPETCRAVAARRFSKARMVESYLRLYRTLVQNRRAEEQCV